MTLDHRGMSLGLVGHHEITRRLKRIEVVLGGDHQKSIAHLKIKRRDTIGDVLTIPMHREHHAVVLLAEVRLGERNSDERGVIADDEFGNNSIDRRKQIGAD